MMPHQTLHHAICPRPADDSERFKQAKYDGLYMDIACRIALMSHDRDMQVGCVLVKDNNIIAFGWNGTPRGFGNECKGPDGHTLHIVTHAEMNAFAKLARNGTSGCFGSTLYCTLSPCYDCSKLMIQSGVVRLVYVEECRNGRPMLDFLRKSGMKVDQLA